MNKTRFTIKNKKPYQQQGVALTMSLVFLVLISIIGVTSIRGTAMNELMSTNFQQKRTVSQVAESVIEAVWETGYILKKTPAQINDAPAVDIALDPNDLVFNDMFDIPANGSSAAININANASLQYCGEESRLLGYQQSADESMPSFVAHVYSIRGKGKIAATKTSADHDQRGYLVRPETGRTGNCS